MRFLPGFCNSVVNSRHFSHKIQPVKLSYDEYLPKDPQSASGAPLLIMHGLFGSRQNWRGISKRLTQVLNPCRRIFSVDGRNHGLSPHASEHTYQHMAEDVKELIRDIGAEKVVLLGHSMGGRCMMYFALEYVSFSIKCETQQSLKQSDFQPELVESAVIVDISPFSNVHFAGSTEAMTDLLRALQGITIDSSLSPSAARKVVDEEISSIMTEKATRDFILLNLYKDEHSG